MVKSFVTLDEVIKFFNELIALDHKAVTELLTTRVECNQAFADHPSVQVGRMGNDPARPYEVGLIGLINGLFGTIEEEGRFKGWGPFAVELDWTSEEHIGRVVTKVGKTLDPDMFPPGPLKEVV